MALVKNRRQLNLRLPMVDRPRFPPPLPTTAATTTTSSVSTSLTAADIEKLEVLGHGNGGTVYKILHKRTSAIYALKVVCIDSDPAKRRQILREISILRRTDSPYIVKCYDVLEKTGGDISIMMEYMDKGTLESLLKSGIVFSEEVIAKIAYQVVQGLDHLHSHKIIHRDLKPSNLLVNTDMQVKIADFGVSRIMCRTLDPCNSYVGTCAYMSPERFDPETYGNDDRSYNGYASDIWSLGLTLLELYMGRFPLLPAGQRPDWATLMCSICFGEPPVIPESASEEFKSFAFCCLQKDSANKQLESSTDGIIPGSLGLSKTDEETSRKLSDSNSIIMSDFSPVDLPNKACESSLGLLIRENNLMRTTKPVACPLSEGKVSSLTET